MKISLLSLLNPKPNSFDPSGGTGASISPSDVAGALSGLTDTEYAIAVAISSGGEFERLKKLFYIEILNHVVVLESLEELSFLDIKKAVSAYININIAHNSYKASSIESSIGVGRGAWERKYKSIVAKISLCLDPILESAGEKIYLAQC